MVIVIRGMLIAVQAQDTFTRLLAGSLAMTFFVYVIVNTGMVTGLLPVVGVPLPMISYGGTSIVTLMAGFVITSYSIHYTKLYEGSSRVAISSSRRSIKRPRTSSKIDISRCSLPSKYR